MWIERREEKKERKGRKILGKIDEGQTACRRPPHTHHHTPHKKLAADKIFSFVKLERPSSLALVVLLTTYYPLISSKQKEEELISKYIAMDFSRPHEIRQGTVTRSGIQLMDDAASKNNDDNPLHNMVLDAANQAAKDLFLGNDNASNNSQNDDSSDNNNEFVNASLYTERLSPLSQTIQKGSLVVIFESFDTLNFAYATPGAIFNNRNGNFYHDDFIGKVRCLLSWSKN